MEMDDATCAQVPSNARTAGVLSLDGLGSLIGRNYWLDEFGMCRSCTIKCANCNKAVQYDDDLDDDQEPQQQ